MRYFFIILVAFALCSTQLSFAATTTHKKHTATHAIKKHVTKNQTTKLKSKTAKTHSKSSKHKIKKTKPLKHKQVKIIHHETASTTAPIKLIPASEPETPVTAAATPQDKPNIFSFFSAATPAATPSTTASTTTTSTQSNTTTNSVSLTTYFKQKLINFVHLTVETLNDSYYKLGGTRFDTTHGVYIIDCSSYVDHILEKVYPSAYSKLVNSCGTDKPTSQHYYDFFKELSINPKKNWQSVNGVSDLEPGDILVFRFRGREVGGHVMVVMNKPEKRDNAYFVRVADSASAGHSQDTREPHTSGIGIGTLLLKVNPETDQPSAYAWKIGSVWERHVKFAMARPVELSTPSFMRQSG